MRQALVAVGLVALAGCHGDPVRPAGRDREPAGPVVRLVYSMDVGDRGDGGNDDAGVGAPADRKAALEQAVDTIRRRIADRGVADPAVAAAGDRIVVELPGADPEATDRVRDVLARRGDLVVRVVDSGAPLMKALYGRVGSRHPSTEPEAAAAGIVAYPDYWQNPADGSNVFDYTLQAEDRQESMSRDRARELGCIGAPSPDGLVACTVSGRERLARYLADVAAADPSLAVPANHLIAYERVQYEGRPPTWRTYYVERTARLGARDLANATAERGAGDQAPVVMVTLDADGARRLAELTRATVGKKLAIMVDDQVQAAPIVEQPITGGRLPIPVGGPDAATRARAAAELAELLRAGALPAPLRLETMDRGGAPPS